MLASSWSAGSLTFLIRWRSWSAGPLAPFAVSRQPSAFCLLPSAVNPLAPFQALSGVALFNCNLDAFGQNSWVNP